jgi:pyridoxamine 5'-phosphate oxidase family protein
MSSFSDAELTYLAKGKLGRLATIDVNGLPHLVPLGWTYNEELDTIDVRGRDFDHTRKFHNVQANPNVALVVDDVVPPWQPRCVLIRGRAQALHDTYGPDGEALGPTIRITPSQVISWGMDVVDRP